MNTAQQTRHTPAKWRPSLISIVALVLAAILALPLAGLFFFRLYENQLIHQTEGELISQSAVLAAVMASRVRNASVPDLRLGARVPDRRLPNPAKRYHPIAPRIDLASDAVLPPRPQPRKAASPPQAFYIELGRDLFSVGMEAQQTTLAGLRILDPFGTIIAGRTGTGASLSHVSEVKDALQGKFTSVLRQRISDEPPPPVYSISRGTGVRVFTAMPVIVNKKVAGVIYMSRTPNNILRHLYQERRNVILAAFAIIAVAALIGFVFVRTISGPVQALTARTHAIARGDRSKIRPLKRHGSREIAALSESFLDMADKLNARSDYITNFAAHVSHEIKSPIASIRGAAELLQDAGADMTDQERGKFLANILSDTDKLTALVSRLRDLAQADNPQLGGVCNLEDAANTASDIPGLTVTVEGHGHVAMSLENAGIVFGHLLHNAHEHGAKAASITIKQVDGMVHCTLSDNGDGVSAGNRARIFDAFFTTRRETGGTGMGLHIVQAMLSAHSGSIKLTRDRNPTVFEFTVPAAAEA